MPRWVDDSGKVYEWTGNGTCFCSKCKEIFGSVFAFDKHLKRGRGRANAKGPARHDIKGLIRNDKGYLVTGVMPKGIHTTEETA